MENEKIEFKELIEKLIRTKHPLAKKVAIKFRKAENGFSERFNYVKANKVLRGCFAEAEVEMEALDIVLALKNYTEKNKLKN